jgi:hypothetical protein
MRVVWFLTGLLLAATASPSRAYCERYPTVAEEFAEAEYVFLAQVTSARLDPADDDPDGFEGIEYSVRALRSYKGEPPANLLLFSENSTGRWPMMVGGWYLVFVGSKRPVGFDDPARREYAVSNCGNSFAVSHVPMALQAPPTDLSFEALMALAPPTD